MRNKTLLRELIKACCVSALKYFCRSKFRKSVYKSQKICSPVFFIRIWRPRSNCFSIIAIPQPLNACYVFFSVDWVACFFSFIVQKLHLVVFWEDVGIHICPAQVWLATSVFQHLPFVLWIEYMNASVFC